MDGPGLQRVPGEPRLGGKEAHTLQDQKEDASLFDLRLKKLVGRTVAARSRGQMGRCREAGREVSLPRGVRGRAGSRQRPRVQGWAADPREPGSGRPEAFPHETMFAVLRSPGSFSQTHVRIMGLPGTGSSVGEGSRRQVLHH